MLLSSTTTQATLPLTIRRSLSSLKLQLSLVSSRSLQDLLKAALGFRFEQTVVMLLRCKGLKGPLQYWSYTPVHILNNKAYLLTHKVSIPALQFSKIINILIEETTKFGGNWRDQSRDINFGKFLVVVDHCCSPKFFYCTVTTGTSLLFGIFDHFQYKTCLQYIYTKLPYRVPPVLQQYLPTLLCINPCNSNIP